ncbi:MAG: hypothetical protein UX98_C0005G0032 [Parcubacteria group bacterium GW2011_GWA2_47_26]|nr:MAG: hypothetical protein UX98_C0005G0032 [Parcubacteria group bacterium GW2011_GWA2_47_26]
MTHKNMSQPTIPAQIRGGVSNLFGNAGFVTTEGTGNIPLALRIGVLVNTALMLTGMVFLLLTVYSGIQWMMAGGNEETVKKARTRIVRATIGLIIVVGSWIITRLILNAVFGPVRQPGAIRFN